MHLQDRLAVQAIGQLNRRPHRLRVGRDQGGILFRGIAQLGQGNRPGGGRQVLYLRRGNRFRSEQIAANGTISLPISASNRAISFEASSAAADTERAGA